MNDDSESPDHEPVDADGLVRLSFEEARVLGCLLEKEATTPDYYPLTLNALQAACNQSSNRDPHTDFDTDVVEEAMEGLRYKGLSLLVHQSGARVAKNKHTIENEFPYLTEGERSLLCVMLLRGPQTLGELRQRTERMHHFADLDSTGAALEKLIQYDPNPLAKLLPAGGGRRVATYMHLLCGEPDATAAASPAISSPRAAAETAAGPTWREEMEQQMASLKSRVDSLQEEVDRLREELGG